jgi:hypothetical protein
MKLRHRNLFIVVALVALASMAALASIASAAKPAAPYEDFAGCPSEVENPESFQCQKSEFTGGHITFGNRQVPITNTITLRGGIEAQSGNFVFNSEGGMLPAQQTVPGGIIGMTGLKWLDEFSAKQLQLHATVELAGQPGSIFEESFLVPVKLHLESPLLGKGCYIGSSASPIDLNLTVGATNPPAPNMPISGHPTSPQEPEASRPEVTRGEGGLFVDNAYAVPAASGCQLQIGGFTLLPLDNLINSAYKLPAAAGTNESMLDYNVSRVSTFTVYPEG